MHAAGLAARRFRMHEKGNAKGVDRMAPEEVVLDAMGAYEALARHALMASRGDGLTKTETDIIMRLCFCGKSSMSNLADDLSVSKEHITRSIASLVKRGLVEKHRSSENFRMVKATLTEKGLKLAQAIRLASNERVRQRLDVVSEQDRETLLRASEQASAIIHKILRA